MAASESLRFDLIANDRVSEAFARVGRATSELGAKMDSAALKSALLDDALKRQAETAKRSADATLALAKSDEILNEVEHRLRDGALEAEFALKRETEAKKKSRDAALEAAAANKILRDSFKNRDWLTVLTGGSGTAHTGILSRIGNLVPGLAGTGGGASGFGALAPAASGLANPYVIAGGAVAAAAAAPFLGQLLSGGAIFGLGSGLAGLGIAGAFGTGKTVTPAQLTAAQDALAAAQLRVTAAQAAAARKPGAASQATLVSAQGAVVTAQAKLAQLQNNAQDPAQIRMRQAFAGLSNDAQNSLAQIGKSFIPVMQSVFNTADSVLKKMTPVFAAAERTIAGPFKVFADTLISSFAQPAVKNSIQAVAGSFGKLLTALTPQLGGDVAQVADGISRIARSVADHPQAFADFVQGFFKLAGMALDGISALANFGGYLQQHFWPAMHRTSVIWDGVRHEFMHITDDMTSALIRTWGATWNDTIGVFIRFGHDVERDYNDFRHRTAVVFDGMRGDISHYWDMTWNNTAGRAARGVDDVARWAGTLPGRITHAVGSVKTLLLQAGKDVITGLWTGVQAIWTGVESWFRGLPSKILHALGIASPPRWSVDAGKHIMGGLLKGIAHGAADVRGFFVNIAKDVAGPFKGIWSGLAAAGKDVWHFLSGSNRAPGGVSQWAGTVLQALSMEHLNTGLLGNVLHQMQTESGGNPDAINLTDFNARVLHDPSRGLMQVIGSTFAAFHWPGTSWNIYDPLANIAAALHYARLRYGPDLMWGGMGIGSGHGYALGTLSAAPGWAWVGERGPELMHFRGGEQVYPAAQGGAGTQTIIVKVDPALAAVTPDRTLGRVIAAHITKYIVSGGRLYPAGTTPR